MHDDGIYFGLNADEYHADEALGSTDVKGLHKWWDWQWERLRGEEPEETASTRFGTLVHKMLLEGEAAFFRDVHIRPEQWADYRTKAAREWRDERMAAGQPITDQRELERVLAAREKLLQDERCADAFRDGVSEVSIFWTEDGVRCKARFDRLKVGTTVDLKTFRPNNYGDSLGEAVRRALQNFRYDLQAAHYDVARRQLKNFVLSHAVYGECPLGSAWLHKVAAQQEWEWWWVFIKADKSPECIAATLTKGFVWKAAVEQRLTSLSNYRAMVDKYGPHRLWPSDQEPLVLDDTDFPVWFAR
jgi:hypothetical protein